LPEACFVKRKRCRPAGPLGSGSFDFTAFADDKTRSDMNLDGTGPGSYDFYVFEPYDLSAPDLAALAVQASVSVFLV